MRSTAILAFMLILMLTLSGCGSNQARQGANNSATEKTTPIPKAHIDLIKSVMDNLYDGYKATIHVRDSGGKVDVSISLERGGGNDSGAMFSDFVHAGNEAAKNAVAETGDELSKFSVMFTIVKKIGEDSDKIYEWHTSDFESGFLTDSVNGKGMQGKKTPAELREIYGTNGLWE